MAITVMASVNGEEHTLEKKEGIIYQTELQAPEVELKTTASDNKYTIVISAEDEAGNKVIDRSTTVSVTREFDFDFILAKADGEEICYWEDMESADVEVGTESTSGSNTFEATVAMDVWNAEKYAYGNRVYIPDTEYGGLIEDIEPVTASQMVYIRGLTWRGLLEQKVICPREGEINYTVTGDINDVIRELIGERFGTLFYVPEERTQVTVTGWKVDRYASVGQSLQKLVDAKNMRLDIRYDQNEKAVAIKAVPVVDYSDSLEFSQDSRIDFDIRDCRTGINHLICGGQGEGTERTIIDLYVQEDGSIGSIQYYTGLQEREQFYDYASAQTEEDLLESGKKQLESLRNYKKFSMSVNNIDLELGDIVGGREYITGTELKEPVIQKILGKSAGEISLQYKLKGAE